MGIKGLSKYLAEHVPNSIQQRSLCDLFGQTIAVDTNYYMYKYTISTTDFLTKFGNQYEHLRRYGIKPVYVFDGKPPCEKQTMIDKRKKANQKKNVSITHEHLKQLKNYFKQNNIVYLECTAEADFICSKLSQENMIDGCISDDMDFLALGCKRLYRDYYQNSADIVEYRLDEILKVYSHKQFIDICIFLGCDYCERIYDMVNRAYTISVYELFSRFETLEKVWDYLYTNNMLMFVDILKYEEIIKKWEKARIILENQTNFDFTKFKPYVDNVLYSLEKIYDTVPCLIDFNVVEKDTDYTYIKGSFQKKKIDLSTVYFNVNYKNAYSLLDLY